MVINKEIQVKIYELCKEAGIRILKIYNDPKFGVKYKKDNSPVTLADIHSNETITQGLLKLFPDIPVLSEEVEIEYKVRRKWRRFWSIDPLDGTKEFLHRNDEFAINIALIEDGIPVIGIIYIPVSGYFYYSDKNSTHSIKDGIEEEINPDKKFYMDLDVIRIACSRSHLNKQTLEFIEYLQLRGKKVEVIQIGSSIKFCHFIENEADVYPRFAPTMEWDTAAGHAMINNLNGKVLQPEVGDTLLYNKENLGNPFFIAHW